MIVPKTLIFDLECSNKGYADSSTDKPRVFGFYSYITNKYYVKPSASDFALALKNHDVIVGFNQNFYDNHVLKNNGFSDKIFWNEKQNYGKFKNKINVDTRSVIKDKVKIIKTKEGYLDERLMSFSLDAITKALHLVEDDGKIENFDYSIFNKETWTPEEWEKIEEYTKRDLEITKKLYEFIEEYFDGFKDMLPEESIVKKDYYLPSTASYTYKVFCHKLGLPETYGFEPRIEFGGGYVAYPAGETFEGKLQCRDFNSLYPSIFHQCNLAARIKPGDNYEGPLWHGNGVFDVEGYYDATELCEISKILRWFYEYRLKLKKNKDPREYSVKIIINTFYGMICNPSFEQFYDITAGADCTRIGRQWTKLARKMFKEDGYNLIYTDTDSVYLEDPFNDAERLEKSKDRIIAKIKENVPFPYEHFDMGLDDAITHMFFFHGDTGDKKSDSEMDDDDFINKPKKFLKKNYIYLTEDGKLVYKNLGVKKKDTSAMTRKIFREILIPKIKEEKKVKFPRSFFKTIITELLQSEPELMSKRFAVRKPEEYNSITSVNYKIAEAYGAGYHFMVKNKKYGIGSGVKYAPLDDLKKGKLQIEDLDLSGIWSELEYFIEKEKVKTLFDY